MSAKFRVQYSLRRLFFNCVVRTLKLDIMVKKKLQTKYHSFILNLELKLELGF